MSAEGAPGAADQEGVGPAPSEEELRAAYEEELSRITSTDLMLQTAVSLINLGGRRLGPPPGGPQGETVPGAGKRDMEQVRDAIDGVRALLSVLERRLSTELGPLRDALSQLQLAYASEAGGAQAGPAAAGSAQGPEQSHEGREEDDPNAQSGPQKPGPAQASGRLWVPGS
jgi:hypothetical protein